MSLTKQEAVMIQRVIETLSQQIGHVSPGAHSTFYQDYDEVNRLLGRYSPRREENMIYFQCIECGPALVAGELRVTIGGSLPGVRAAVECQECGTGNATWFKTFQQLADNSHPSLGFTNQVGDDTSLFAARYITPEKG